MLGFAELSRPELRKYNKTLQGQDFLTKKLETVKNTHRQKCIRVRKLISTNCARETNKTNSMAVTSLRKICDNKKNKNHSLKLHYLTGKRSFSQSRICRGLYTRLRQLNYKRHRLNKPRLVLSTLYSKVTSLRL